MRRWPCSARACRSRAASIRSRSRAMNGAGPAPPAAPAVWPFAVMCAGMFIALLDIQIVASSLQDIGGGLSAAQDRDFSWVQTAYLIAEIVVIPLSGWLTRVFSTRWLFTIVRGRLHRRQHAVRAGVEHPQHDRVPRAAGPAGRVDDPDRVHLLLPFLPGAPARLFGGGGRRHRLARADARPGDRRLDHRHVRLALAVLREPGAGHRHHRAGAMLVRIDEPDLSTPEAGRTISASCCWRSRSACWNTCWRKARAGTGSTMRRSGSAPGSPARPACCSCSAA